MELTVKRIENRLTKMCSAFFNPMGYVLELFNIYIGYEDESHLIIEFILKDRYANILKFHFITEYNNWLSFNCDTFVIDTVLDKVEIGVYLQKFMKIMVHDLSLMRDLELYSILAYNKSIC